VAALSGIERERSVGIDSYASAPLPLHPTGLFQSRWIDFHVRELAEDGVALSLTDVPQQADALAPLAHRHLCSFVMCKENRTTSDALRQVAAAAGVPLSSLAVAGAKDKRAVTVQRVTGRGIDAPKLLRVNDKWTAAGSRVRVGHFAAADRSLGLDQARGNQFVVILRDLEVTSTCHEAHAQAPAGGAAGEADGDGTASIFGNSEGLGEEAWRRSGRAVAGEGLGEEALRGACSAALSRVAAGGFVNYFGLQRFGSGEGVATHAVGALLLRGAFRRGLQAILDPTAPGLSAAERAARAHYGATADAAAALRLLPRRGGQTLTQRLLSSYAARLSAASTAAADTAVAGTAVADTAVADTAVADTAVADKAVAGTAVAGTAVAGTAVADMAAAGATVVGATTWPSAVAASAAHASAHRGAASAGALEASALEAAAAHASAHHGAASAGALEASALEDAAAHASAHHGAASAGTLEASALEDAAAETTLWRLPFRERLLYVNALQSFAFNRAASYRIRMNASAPIEGDLVWGMNASAPIEGDLVWAAAGGGGAHDGAQLGAHDGAIAEDEGADVSAVVGADAVEGADDVEGSAAADGFEDDGGGAVASVSVGPAVRARALLPPAVKVLSAAEAASGRYTLADVLLPLPGHFATYPLSATECLPHQVTFHHLSPECH
jgi:tRNA(Glu) U13 pseudouridine synthase TruD